MADTLAAVCLVDHDVLDPVLATGKLSDGYQQGDADDTVLVDRDEDAAILIFG
jgi:hypothetical protein